MRIFSSVNMLHISIKIQTIHKLKRGEEEEEEESEQKKAPSETEKGSQCLCRINKQGS